MNNQSRTKEQLINEIALLKKKTRELEALESKSKCVEDEIQKTNQALQAIIDASPLAIFALDRDSRVTYWSPSAERIFGWRSEEVIGLYNPIVPPEKRDEFKALFSKVISGTAYGGSEVWRQTKDGRSIFVNVSTAPLRDASGSIIGAMGVIQDITENKKTDDALRESEERLRYLCNNIPNGLAYQVVIEADGQRRFTYISNGVENLHEVKPEAVIADPMLLYSQYIAEEGTKMAEAEEYALRNMTVFNIIAAYRTPKGDLRWSHIRSTPRRLPDGGTAWDGIETDISDRIKADKERERLISELQGAIADIKKLSGLLPICAACKKIRNDKGYWEQIESYIKQHSEVEFSHGICPECAKRLYPDQNKDIRD